MILGKETDEGCGCLLFVITVALVIALIALGPDLIHAAREALRS